MQIFKIQFDSRSYNDLKLKIKQTEEHGPNMSNFCQSFYQNWKQLEGKSNFCQSFYQNQKKLEGKSNFCQSFYQKQKQSEGKSNFQKQRIRRFYSQIRRFYSIKPSIRYRNNQKKRVLPVKGTLIFSWEPQDSTTIIIQVCLMTAS